MWQNQNVHLNLENISTPLLRRECIGEDFYRPECLYKEFCPQINAYFINAGIVIIIVYIIGLYLTSWFFNRGYKRFKYNKESSLHKYIGDLNKFETRAYWSSYINRWLSIMLLGYCVVVVYMSM